MSRRTTVVLMILACLLHLWAFHQSSHSPFIAPPGFAHPLARSDPGEVQPRLMEEFVSPPVDGITVHAASLCELSDGRLAAAWYAGSREGGKDVSIYFSKRSVDFEEMWDEPRVIVDRASASKELDRYLRKIGNSILFASPGDRLWLIYVTVSLGGWGGSSLNVKTSQDGGETWSKSVRLTLSPFLNVSELVRNRPLPLMGERFAVPIYHEFLGRFPEILWISMEASDSTFHWRKTRMAGGRDFIQPSIAPFDEKSGAAFYRDMSNRRSVAMATTRDAGQTWSTPQAIDLPNPNSGIHVLPLPAGRILMAFNDSKHDRDNLRLAVSSDGGEYWIRIATLDDRRGAEFSYPYMLRDQWGQTHVVYTWKRKRVKHVVFNDAWIEARIGEALR